RAGELHYPTGADVHRDALYRPLLCRPGRWYRHVRGHLLDQGTFLQRLGSKSDHWRRRASTIIDHDTGLRGGRCRDRRTSPMASGPDDRPFYRHHFDAVVDVHPHCDGSLNGGHYPPSATISGFVDPPAAPTT